MLETPDIDSMNASEFASMSFQHGFPAAISEFLDIDIEGVEDRSQPFLPLFEPMVPSVIQLRRKVKQVRRRSKDESSTYDDPEWPGWNASKRRRLG